METGELEARPRKLEAERSSPLPDFTVSVSLPFCLSPHLPFQGRRNETKNIIFNFIYLFIVFIIYFLFYATISLSLAKNRSNKVYYTIFYAIYFFVQ